MKLVLKSFLFFVRWVSSNEAGQKRTRWSKNRSNRRTATYKETKPFEEAVHNVVVHVQKGRYGYGFHIHLQKPVLMRKNRMLAGLLGRMKGRSLTSQLIQLTFISVLLPFYHSTILPVGFLPFQPCSVVSVVKLLLDDC